MATTENPRHNCELSRLLHTTLKNIRNYTETAPKQWLLVDSNSQQLFLVREGMINNQWNVSTALNGLNNKENSGGTPPGVHKVARKIGKRATSGAVFESRKLTGENWVPEWNKDEELKKRDLVLSRILVLDGLEPGVNQGPGIDSRERYIYVHGTNREDLIGQPVSHGCIRMNNSGIIDLFELVEEGDFLVIV
ncbi:MAG: L,D-transpeptidase [bacterium]|nr:L,D-transpeptidase [bacterium]